MKFVPVILFVYNRPVHTKRTLDALRLNRHIEASTLYVFSDGPKEQSTAAEKEAIAEVRALVSSIDFCKEVIISEEKSNRGLAASVIAGVSEVVRQHGKVIVLEDDIITGVGFLEYMNEALHLYEDNPTIFGVSGYKYPTHKKIKQSSYLLPIASSWSYGTWERAWNSVNFDGKQLLGQVNNRDRQAEMNFGNHPFYEMLSQQVKGTVDSWAIRFYASMFLANKLFIFPNASLAQNIGFDSSGTHCKEDAYFSEVFVTNETIKVGNDLQLNKDIVAIFEESFRRKNRPNRKKPKGIKSKVIQVVKSIGFSSK